MNTHTHTVTSNWTRIRIFNADNILSSVCTWNAENKRSIYRLVGCFGFTKKKRRKKFYKYSLCYHHYFGKYKLFSWSQSCTNKKIVITSLKKGHRNDPFGLTLNRKAFLYHLEFISFLLFFFFLHKMYKNILIQILKNLIYSSFYRT